MTVDQAIDKERNQLRLFESEINRDQETSYLQKKKMTEFWQSRAFTKRTCKNQDVDAEVNQFKLVIYQYLLGRRKATLWDSVNDALWHYNNGGKSLYHMDFNELKQRCFIDKAFWNWCRYYCETLSMYLSNRQSQAQDEYEPG